MSMINFTRTAAGAAFAVGLLTLGAAAQDGQTSVLVYDYAVSHPTEDAVLQMVPSIGASVPQGVQLATVDTGDGVYGYFYFQGRPVIVELGTRSIVRLDE